LEGGEFTGVARVAGDRDASRGEPAGESGADAAGDTADEDNRRRRRSRKRSIHGPEVERKSPDDKSPVQKI
jgi:hypothetical protein